MPNPVATIDVCKDFGSTRVLDRVSLVVERGRLFGFLGPNGAGKSTTLRILLGLLRQSDGEATLFGEDCWSHGPRIRERVGYLPGEPRFHRHLTGAQTLAFVSAVRRIDCRSECARLVDAFGLDISRSVRNYSSGMKQKLGLIAAMMHRPDLLILDEPTNALDPLVRITLFELLRESADNGATVLFSSHTLGEVEELCDEVAILRDGRIVVQDRVETLRGKCPRRVELVLNPDLPNDGEPPTELRVLRETNGRLTFTWSGELDALLVWIRAQQPTDVTIAPPDLGDLFLGYYESDAKL